jgi:hypothetical protein
MVVKKMMKDINGKEYGGLTDSVTAKNNFYSNDSYRRYGGYRTPRMIPTRIPKRGRTMVRRVIAKTTPASSITLGRWMTTWTTGSA